MHGSHVQPRSKQDARDLAQLEREMRRAQRIREIKCFWTRPFKHEFVNMVDRFGRVTGQCCLGCGARRQTHNGGAH